MTDHTTTSSASDRSQPVGWFTRARAGLARVGVHAGDDEELRQEKSLLVLLAILIEPYRMERLTSFINPAADAGGAGFQGIQASIALGSGGLFGVGLGESVQKAFYLPEAHTDMIAAVIGEELGLVGMTVLVGLFGMFGYAGFRTAQRARAGGVKKHLNARGFAILGALDTVAAKHEATPAQVALAWLLAQPAIGAPIASATTTAQLAEILKCAEVKLSADDVAALSKASA